MWCISAVLVLFFGALLQGPSRMLVGAFNLDLANYIRHEGQTDSMFGFSVALHQEKKRSWVIIGAPTADSSSIQPNVQRGGLVYKCDIAEDNRCNIIPFDRNGNQRNERLEQVDTKSYQWFGATVASAGIDGPVVACAPRYVFHTIEPRKAERVEPVGTCYTARNNFNEFTEYSPCRTMYWGYHRQGSCQAGFSAAISKNGERLFVGAPGSWYWQGQVYSIHTDTEYPYKPPRYGQFGEGGQIYGSSIIKPHEKPYSTGESTAEEDDSYLGYSSASISLVGEKISGVAVGMPRGGGLLGKVLLFTWNMTNVRNITGEQIGAYFGYSLCVVDVNGDGLEDLIIGAPMYTEKNNEGKFEMGRVYIMYQHTQFHELHTRDGINSRGRFGLSLTSLGDITHDGFGDFAVGAPYDGPKGHGAVYIYHGSEKGPLAKPSQVIFAEDIIGTPYLSTFGFSISGGIDLDGNQYPDLVIGAYESNKAIVLKARPVASLKASTYFEVDNKLISLEDPKCTTIGVQKSVTCAKLVSCFNYTGINLPGYIHIDITWVLDSKLRQPRMFFINTSNSTMKLGAKILRGHTACYDQMVYITDSVHDKLTPLEVEMKYQLQTTQPTTVRQIRAILEPVLDENLGLVQHDTIYIKKNCGPDNECIPDLLLEITSVDKFLLGSKELSINVSVTNLGQDAFETNFYMIIPPGLHYGRMENRTDLKDIIFTCTPSHLENGFQLVTCNLGNPFSGGNHIGFEIFMDPSQKPGMAPTYEFYMEVNSTNTEKSDSRFNNVIKKSIGIILETELLITGSSHPYEIHLNLSKYTELAEAVNEDQLGPQVVHLYKIKNDKSSTIDEAEIYIVWPYETLDGETLMYMTGMPESSNNIKCEQNPFVNHLKNIQINETLASTSYLSLYAGFNKHEHSYHYTEMRYEQVTVVSSAGSGSSVNIATGLTEDKKKLLDEEEHKESTGDASYDHLYRVRGQGQTVHHHSTGGGGGTISFGNATHNQDGRVHTYTTSWNVTSGPQGTVTHQTFSNSTSQGRGSTGSASQHGGTMNYGASYTQGGGNRYRQQGGRSSEPDVFKVDDVMTEEYVSQDISKLNSRPGTVATTSHTSFRGPGSAGSGQASGSSSSTFDSTSGTRRMMSQQDGESARPDLITGVSISPLEKMAQGGQGFQTSTFDVGTANRENVDEELRRRGSSASGLGGGGHHQISSTSSNNRQYNTGGGGYYGGSTGGGSYHTSSTSGGGYHGGASSGGQTGYSTSSRSSSYSPPATHFSQTGYSQNEANTGRNFRTHNVDNIVNTNKEEEDDYTYEDDDYEYSDAGSNGAGTTHSNLRTHDLTDAHRSDPRSRHYRSRRFTDNQVQLDQELTCDLTKCAILRCKASPMGTFDSWIAIRTRVVARTVDKMTLAAPVIMSTKMVSRISKLPYIGTPEDMQLKSAEVKFEAIPEPIPKPDIVPLWIIVLSACAGTIILLLLIFLLYKCGFFKRNRPSGHSSERQPLNRNGNYHGDEHL